MTAVIFTSQRTHVDDNYSEINDDLEKLAVDQKGFIKVESLRNPDGFGISVSYWETAEDARAWKLNQPHAKAQEKGKKDWYIWYDVKICEVQREYSWGDSSTAGD